LGSWIGAIVLGLVLLLLVIMIALCIKELYERLNGKREYFDTVFKRLMRKG